MNDASYRRSWVLYNMFSNEGIHPVKVQPGLVGTMREYAARWLENKTIVLVSRHPHSLSLKVLRSKPFRNIRKAVI